VDSLDPDRRYIGNDKFGSYPYYVFIFKHHVVAECPLEGNAIYVIEGTEDWQSLLNRSKRNLLAAVPNRVSRVLHTGAWQNRLSRLLGP